MVWATLIALGAYHGINPGMGWLFAVALGLQEGSRRAVIRAFAPIALGHALSIAMVVGLVAALQTVVPPVWLRYGVAGVLVAFGLYKLLAPMSHPRWVGMRVGSRELVLWSFLMATAHGAGLMLAPLVLKIPPAATGVPASPTAASPSGVSAAAKPTDPHAGHAMGGTPSGPERMPEHPAGSMNHADHLQHVQQAAGNGNPLLMLAAVILHTLAMFLVMAGIALIVYEKIGLAILRRAWFNLDLVWAASLIVAGGLTLFL